MLNNQIRLPEYREIQDAIDKAVLNLQRGEGWGIYQNTANPTLRFPIDGSCLQDILIIKFPDSIHEPKTRTISIAELQYRANEIVDAVEFELGFSLPNYEVEKVRIAASRKWPNDKRYFWFSPTIRVRTSEIGVIRKMPNGVKTINFLNEEYATIFYDLLTKNNGEGITRIDGQMGLSKEALLNYPRLGKLRAIHSVVYLHFPLSINAFDEDMAKGPACRDELFFKGGTQPSFYFLM